MDLGSLNGGEVLSEGQASGLHVTGQKPFQFGLEERRPTSTEKIYLASIDVHAHLNDPGFTWREDFAHGTAAAAAGGLRAYVTTKLLTALIVSVFPVTVIFIAGALTGAQMDAPWVWATSYALALLTAVPFACYGLAAGLWVPAQAAVGIAGASISIFAFLGNLFMPLSGSLFDFAHFTPMYGVGNLALRALQGDLVATMSATGENRIVHEALWLPLTSIAVWTLIFVIACLAARRRTTARH